MPNSKSFIIHLLDALEEERSLKLWLARNEWEYRESKANNRLERKNIKRIVAKTISTNEASQRLLMKCGGVKGEVIEDGFLKMFGFKGDACCYVFDRPDFRG